MNCRHQSNCPPAAARFPRVAFCLALLSAAAAFAQEQISFRNDVMAVLSKAGCNAGACHGNANGKASFKLSLRGESPELDFLALTRDQLARRINPIHPEQSLLLLKATMQIAHEGGVRFKKESTEYRLLRDWIAAGAPDDLERAPRLTALVVSPLEQTLVEPETSLQITAKASFSDGTERDVTAMAVYEPVSAEVHVSPNGKVEKGEKFGEATVLVRYLHLQQPVRLAFVPNRPFLWNGAQPFNYIDELVFAKLRRLRLNPSELCSDQLFIRRASLDLLGLLPSAEEARAFLVNPRPDKRARLVDELLQRPAFADFWALKWADLLRIEERILDRKGIEQFHRWIRQSIASGKPMDQFAREILAARGSTYQNPPANFYRALRDPVSRAESAAQLFLGVRLQCAQCHNHPFDRWSQDDYYDWAALFSKVQYKVLENRRRDSNDGHEFKGEQIVYLAAKGDFKNPRTGSPARPRLLGAGETAASGDPLLALAEWVASPDNPMFTRAQANRIWYHLLGRGLVEPIDDFRASNPPTHPELLEALARDFASRQFDLRYLIRLIMTSRVYQLSSDPNESNHADEINFSRNLPRRLAAEQLLDCQSQVAGAPVKFNGYPVGLRAAQLPGALAERKRDQRQAEIDNFLEVFGKPPRLLTSECERSCEPTIGQAFQMISGRATHNLIHAAGNRLGPLAESSKSNEELIDELYWAALTRPPSQPELDRALAQFEKAKDRREALEDLTWALLNAKEFLLRH